MDGLATFAWIWILLGLLSGVWMGLRFHDDRWLGGYGTWSRRMVRLGHVSFFGTGGLCLGCAAAEGSLMGAEVAAAVAFVAGALTMPVVCFLAAWHRPMRHLFFIPVLSLLAGAALMVVGGMLAVSPDFGGPGWENLL